MKRLMCLMAVALAGCGKPDYVRLEPGDQVQIEVKEEHSLRLLGYHVYEANERGELVPVGPKVQR